MEASPPINKVLKLREILDDPFKDTNLSEQEKAAMELALKGNADLIIATKMGLALGTVKSLLFRGRNKLGIERRELGWWVLDQIRTMLDGTDE